MKKLFFSLAAIVALFATSCVTEANTDLRGAGNEATVTFSINTAKLGSRAYNDGYKATALTYAIYDKDWKHLQTYTDSFDGVSLEKEITLRLVKNKTYNFVFWTQNPGVNCYTLDLDSDGVKPNVEINYNNLTSNNDNYDAFFGQELNLVVGGSINKTVELRRPFAQINFGTDDLEEAKDMGFDLAQAQVSFRTKAYTKFYLHDGAVDGNPVEVTFTNATPIDTVVGTKTLDTKALGLFYWVSMNYILWPNPNVPADASKDLSLDLCEITVSLPGQENVVVGVPQAPARRNWRTNLVGSLLTEKSIFKVVIMPDPEDAYDQVVPNN